RDGLTVVRDAHVLLHDLGIGAALELQAAARERELHAEVVDGNGAVATAVVATTADEQDADDKSLHLVPLRRSYERVRGSAVSSRSIHPRETGTDTILPAFS